MHGLTSPFDRHGMKSTIEGLFTRRIYAFVPTFTACTAQGCGFNDFTQSAINPSCGICRGTGRIASMHTAHMTCRITWIDAARIDIYRGVVSAEIGDANIQGKYQDLNTYQRVMLTADAYLLVDGQHLKPTSVIVDRSEGITSVDIRAVIVRS